MATASSNLVQIAVIKEAVLGQTPASGDPQLLRFTGESLRFGITTETSQEIRADRQISDLIQTGAESSGDINFELSYGTYDMLFASALANAWNVDELVNGVTLDTYSIEQGFTDINQFIVHRGMGVNTMSLEFAIESIVTGSFGFMGTESERDSATQMPGSPTQQTATYVMDSVTGFADLTVAGQAYPCGISRVSLSTNNNIRAQNALGKLGACTLTLGTFNVTGELSVYFSDGVVYDKYIKNEDADLSWTVSDRDGNEYAFSLPRIRFSDATVNAGGLDQDVELTVPFQALLDPVSGHTIKITRTDGP